jgi:hypothetical protein
MVFGLAALTFGYALFYWGLHHMPQYDKDDRYSLWCLLGLGSVFGKTNPLPEGKPIQLKP